MRFLRLLVIFIGVNFLNNGSAASMTTLPIKKVVIWGHKLHSHTHSYIHWAFSRAFKSMGIETYWLDARDSLAGYDFSNALFITEGQVDAGIPLRDDCFYVLHNCTSNKYTSLIDKGRCLILQVYTHDVIGRAVTQLAHGTFYSVEDKILYQPWATDLLPNEIEAIQKQLPTILSQRSHTWYWIGTIGDGEFGNIGQIEPFKRAGRENGIGFDAMRSCSMEDNIACIQKSYIAPALVGAWQERQGYIPCRIFKNISYGHFGVTNSKMVYDLFEGKIIYNHDTYQLFYDAKKHIENAPMQELYDLMEFVKNKHTYINRIETMLFVLEKIYESKNAQQ